MKRTIKNGSVEIYTETFGNLENTPVLLIAGAMAPAIFWNDYFCRSLADQGFYVIRFDNRDIGKSTHFPQSAPDSGVELPYTIFDMVGDAKYVLDQFSKRRAHLIGHSMGGSIAQLFAVNYPERILSVTALSSPILAKGTIPFVETDAAIMEEMWAVLMSNPMHQSAEAGIPEFRKIWRYLNGDWPMDEQMADDYTRCIYETEVIGPAWNHTHVQSGIRDIFQELKEISFPLLLIHGEHDYLPANPENVKLLAGALPKAESFLLNDGGHMFFNGDIWDILLNKILDHLKRNS